MNRLLKLRRGMTLVEILVVVAIIGILAGLVTINLTSSRVKARDKKRIADVEAVAQALTLYYAANRSYPTAQPVGSAPAATANFAMSETPYQSYVGAYSRGTTLQIGSFVDKYLPSRPQYPNPNPNGYQYLYYGTNGATDHFAVWTYLEGKDYQSTRSASSDWTSGYCQADACTISHAPSGTWAYFVAE
jgi:prepilin-type N-terminal cleavage/methylation domain-containing protein